MNDWLEFGVPLLAVTLLLAGLWLTDQAVNFQARKLGRDLSLVRQSIKLAFWFLGILAVLLVLPVDTGTQGQLITFYGIVVTAVLTLSSTTFVSNMLAGVMLRTAQNFGPGDFVRAGENFGRVTERGLLQTEIQTEDGDLTTLPNLHLISTPYTVVQSTGTVVSATVGLGYDVPRREVEAALLSAAEDVGLEHPFVQIVDLQDYSVTYRVAGFLREPKQLLSFRSGLRKYMLDALHRQGIEIVSPAFMNQRRVDKQRFIPPDVHLAESAPADSPIPEERIFDKAEAAQAIEELREEAEVLARRLETLAQEQAKAPEHGQALSKMRMEYTRNRQEAVKRLLEQFEKPSE